MLPQSAYVSSELAVASERLCERLRLKTHFEHVLVIDKKYLFELYYCSYPFYPHKIFIYREIVEIKKINEKRNWKIIPTRHSKEGRLPSNSVTHTLLALSRFVFLLIQLQWYRNSLCDPTVFDLQNRTTFLGLFNH